MAPTNSNDSTVKPVSCLNTLLALAIPGLGGMYQRGSDPQSTDPHCSLGGGIPQHDGCGGSQNWPFSADTVFTVGHSQVKTRLWKGTDLLHASHTNVPGSLCSFEIYA